MQTIQPYDVNSIQIVKEIDTGGNNAALLVTNGQDSASNAANLGQQQFTTPPPIAVALAEGLPKQGRLTILDLQAGHGALISGAAIPGQTRHGLAIDIDPRVRCVGLGEDAASHVIAGDCTTIYPLLVASEFNASTIVLNPPFSLHWHADRLNALSQSDVTAVQRAFKPYAAEIQIGKKPTIDSTLATFLMALDLLSEQGHGYMICNHATALRLFGDPTAEADSVQSGSLLTHIYGWLHMPNFFDGTIRDLEVAVIYFQRSATIYQPTYRKLTEATPEAISAAVMHFDPPRPPYHSSIYANTAAHRFDAVKQEIAERNDPAKRPSNLWLKPDGRIGVHLTPFQTISGQVPHDLVRALHTLKDQAPAALVVQAETRRALIEAVHSKIWKVQPDLLAAVDSAVAAYEAVRAPFYPLSDIQRIGYLDEHDKITCRKDFGPFKAGETYPLASSTITTERATYKVNNEGEEDEIIVHGQELLFRIETRTGPARTEIHGFMNMIPGQQAEFGGVHAVHPLQDLVAHFEIPAVPDVATLSPAQYRANVDAVRAIGDRIGLNFRRYQTEDIARAAMHDGCILAWEQGLGKTIAALTWPQVKGARRTLIVAPGGLHAQFVAEASSKFGITLIPLESQQDFYRHQLWRPVDPQAAPTWYITSYQALGFNGADENPPKVVKKRLHVPAKLLENRTRGAAAQDYTRITGEPVPLGEDGNGYDYSIGTVKHIPGLGAVRCLFQPSLATLCARSFDCVVIDEGVRLKSDDSFISMGVRILEPRYRLVLTGTPVKNLLDDIFWLAKWSVGNQPDATPRFPYEATSEAREMFANQHMQMHENVTAAERWARTHNGERRKFVKRSPSITNVHHLWKLFGPIVVRRRKDDCGEEIVRKIYKPLEVLPGKAQQIIYRRYLNNPPVLTKAGEEIKNKRAAIGMQLQNLRVAALCPDSPDLRDVNLGPDIKGPAVSWSPMTPKFVSLCTLAADLMQRGEQLIVFSPFHHFSQVVHSRLRSAGVPSIILDGDTSPARRGQLAAEFKAFKHAVLIAGMESMSEGYSFEQCRNVLLPSLSWALDKNSQSVDRVHRVVSKADVTVYVLITKGTIDQRLYSLWHEKGDAANLAIDARLIEQEKEDISLAQLLSDSIAAFDPSAPVFDEKLAEDQWSEIKNRLRHAAAVYAEFHPPVVPLANAPQSQNVTEEDMFAELQAMIAATKSVASSAPAAPAQVADPFASLMAMSDHTPETPAPAPAPKAKRPGTIKVSDAFRNLMDMQ